jgi:predicted RecA/RadA family phage recombinase
MKTYLQNGDTVVVASPGGNASGDFLSVGALHGVAVNTALTGADSPLLRVGVHSLAKATGTAWAQGDPLYFDPIAKNFTKTAAGNLAFGLAFAAALSADAVGQVLIEDGAMVLRSVGGQFTTATASDTVVTGLSKVLSAVANLEDALTTDPETVQAVIGDQAGVPAAGSILIKSWKTLGGTPVAATTFAKKVNWIAFGY